MTDLLSDRRTFSSATQCIYEPIDGHRRLKLQLFLDPIGVADVDWAEGDLIYTEDDVIDVLMACIRSLDQGELVDDLSFQAVGRAVFGLSVVGYCHRGCLLAVGVGSPLPTTMAMEQFQTAIDYLEDCQLQRSSDACEQISRAMQALLMLGSGLTDCSDLYGEIHGEHYTTA